MKSKLFLPALCLCFFTAIGQAQVGLQTQRAADASLPVVAPQLSYVSTEEEVFIMGDSSAVHVSQTPNVAIGLRAPDEFTVDMSVSTPYGAPQGQTVHDEWELFWMLDQPTQEDLQQQQMMEALGEQLEVASQKAMMKGMVRSIWNGQGANYWTIAGISEDLTIATAWGISVEQLEQIGERTAATMEQMGGLMEAAMLNMVAEMGIPLDENGSTPDGWEPDMETMLKMQTSMLDMMESSMETMGSMMNTAVAEAFDEFLTPEQWQTMQESQLANIEALPFFSPSAFEALDLSDAQREQMEQLRQELAPDFETMLDTWVDGNIAMEKRLDEEYSKELALWRDAHGEQERLQHDLLANHLRQYEAGQELAPGESIVALPLGENGENVMYVIDQVALEQSREEWSEIRGKMMDRDGIRKRLLAEDPEYKRLSEEMQSKSKAFAENFKMRMSDVLTDEQWDRLQELIDNPPEHALAYRKVLREMLGGSYASEEIAEASKASEVNEKPGTYVPGPNSWRPGDGTPGRVHVEQPNRFPRGEN